LAERRVGVSLNADIGSVPVGVEDVHVVDVLGGEFDSVDDHVVEHAGGLVDCSDVGTADVGEVGLVALDSGVDPSILFGHSHNLVN